MWQSPDVMWQEEDDFTEREFGRPPVSPDAPPKCVDDAEDAPGAFLHPVIGTCKAFTAELCELHGRETVGPLGASASVSCCACKAITPTTCDDAYFHVRNSYTEPNKYNFTTCPRLISGMKALGFGCETLSLIHI